MLQLEHSAWDLQCSSPYVSTHRVPLCDLMNVIHFRVYALRCHSMFCALTSFLPPLSLPSASLLVIFLNKAILTSYEFPHFNFLATVQFITTVVVLTICMLLKKIDIPRISWQIIRDIVPISLMFLGNIISGLGGTRNLSLPMFTALRRFSILMTMLAEWHVLNSKPTSEMSFAVALMVGGSSIAAFFDFSYDPTGYLLVFTNNLFTALNGVYMKKALTSDNLRKNNMAILYYNSLFSACFMLLYFASEAALVAQQNYVLIYGDGNVPEGLPGRGRRGLVTTGAELSTSSGGLGLSGSLPHEFATSEQGFTLKQSTLEIVYNFEGWDSTFTAMFIVGALLGSVLNYSIFLCTQYNSALTTAVIGCLKNVATSYVGMIYFADFVFNWPNFIGINISIAGSLYFTYYELFLRKK